MFLLHFLMEYQYAPTTLLVVKTFVEQLLVVLLRMPTHVVHGKHLSVICLV